VEVGDGDTGSEDGIVGVLGSEVRGGLSGEVLQGQSATAMQQIDTTTVG
jgi:hypothetical protein